MQFAILVVVVAALAGSAGASSHPPHDVLVQSLATAAFACVAPLAALVGNAALARELVLPRGRRELWQARAEKLEMAVTWLWVAGSLAILFLVGWPQVAAAAVPDLPLARDLAVLLPPLASLVAVWAAAHRLARAAARSCPGASAAMSLPRHLVLQARHHLALALLPTLLVAGVYQAAALLPSAGGTMSWWPALVAAASVMLLPLVLLRLWHVTPLEDGPQRARLLDACRDAGCPVRWLFQWHTDGTVANALVVGFLPGLRIVLLSDALLARLNDDELAVVVRHEAAHLARRHLAQRLVVLALPLAALAAVHAAWPEVLRHTAQWLAGAGIPAQVCEAVLGPALLLAFAVVVIGWLSRRHEYEADAVACRGQDGKVDPAAIARLDSALSRLVGPHRRHQAGWLHPSVEQRVARLRRLAGG
jgi:STE24 endopeptidase